MYLLFLIGFIYGNENYCLPLSRLLFAPALVLLECKLVRVHVCYVHTWFAGKDGKVNVFRLIDFEGEAAETVTRTRADCREHRLERTKGQGSARRNMSHPSQPLTFL